MVAAIDDPPFRIAAARRMLAREGCESMVAGHVSQRSPNADAFWISPFEYFDETLPDRVIEVGFDLSLRRGSWEASPAVQFHAAIYQERGDVGAIVHTHSRYISALVTRQEPVRAYNIVAALFEDKQSLYLEDGLRPPVEGKSVATALDDNDVLLLSNHGVIVVAPTLEEATVNAILIEQAARFQLEVSAAGGTTLPAELMRRRVAFFRDTASGQLWEANLDRVRHTDPDLFVAT
jgi:L-fuculose-phosphate aldolase